MKFVGKHFVFIFPFLETAKPAMERLRHQTMIRVIRIKRAHITSIHRTNVKLLPRFNMFALRTGGRWRGDEDQEKTAFYYPLSEETHY